AVEVNLGGWDTHDDNFTRIRSIGGQLDVAFARLVHDLKRSKLWESTVVVCHGEFGRTPRINERNGRGHYPRAWNMVVSGGPIVRGRVIGKTDERGEAPVEEPVQVPDFFFSMSHAFGFDPLRKFEVNERPIWYADKTG